MQKCSKTGLLLRRLYTLVCHTMFVSSLEKYELGLILNSNGHGTSLQPGSVSVAKAVAKEIQTGNVDSIFHIGDISYATGFLVEWDFFLHLITPLASQVPYMTAIGNHER